MILLLFRDDDSKAGFGLFETGGQKKQYPLGCLSGGIADAAGCRPPPRLGPAARK